MMRCKLAPWEPSEEGEECVDDDRDLVSSLENYTRELGRLCGGLEVVEAEDEDTVDADINTDTLSSLEEMSSECSALLACLEAGEYILEETDKDHQYGILELDFDTEVLNDEQQQLQEHLITTSHEENLAHELDTFADELKNLALCLEDIDIEDYDPGVSTAGFGHDGNCQIVEQENDLGDVDAFTAQATTVNGDCNVDKMVLSADKEEKTSDQSEVFSRRSKNAIVSHVKRLALQKQRRLGNGNQFRASTISESDSQQQSVHGVNNLWSKYQSSSFQQHIIRQKFARKRVQQTQETQRLIERARLRGTSHRHSAKGNTGKLQKERRSNGTYLDHFTSTSKNSSSTIECDPRYLCAVYLYGLRRLGITYITFSSLTQFEERVRARFAVKDVVSIYREVTEAVLPTNNGGGRLNRRGRHIKRLQRLTRLEQVEDGDVLCVTQNAYDDMNILCDWIKRRQRVIHGFQVDMRKDSSSTFKDKVVQPAKLKPSGNNTTNARLWDSKGHIIGLKVQRDI